MILSPHLNNTHSNIGAPFTDFPESGDIFIAGLPLLFDTVSYLLHSGIKRIILLTKSSIDENYLKNMFFNSIGSKIHYQHIPDSDMNSIFEFLRRIISNSDGEILLAENDSLTRQTFAPLMDVFHRTRCLAAFSLSPCKLSSEFKSENDRIFVETTPSGRIIEFVKSENIRNITTNLSTSSLLVLKKEVLELTEFFPACSINLFSQLLQTFIRLNIPISAETTGGYYRKINTPQNYLEAYHDVLSHRLEPWFNRTPENGIMLSPDSEIHRTCRFSGTIWIDRGVVIMENCSLENCVIMKGSVIGPGSVLRNCLVIQEAIISECFDASDKYFTILGTRNHA